MLTESLSEVLAREGLNLEQFRELTVRLFAYGILVRAEEGLEAELYDRGRRIEPLLAEYFQLSGFRLLHDETNEFFRLFAPGARPADREGDDLEPVPSLRAQLSTSFVAAALALRFLYQQGLAEGSRVTDAGEVMIRLDELAQTLHTTLNRKLPDGLTERRRLLAELKRHRLLRIETTFDATDEEQLMAIRPTILGIISEDTLAAALETGALEAADATDADATDVMEQVIR
jgi:hypothetical protein